MTRSIASIGCAVVVFQPFKPTESTNTPPPPRVLPSEGLMGMCRWMESHFHNWTDYNGVTFLVELLEWGPKFLGFLE